MRRCPTIKPFSNSCVAANALDTFPPPACPSKQFSEANFRWRPFLHSLSKRASSLLAFGQTPVLAVSNLWLCVLATNSFLHRSAWAQMLISQWLFTTVSAGYSRSYKMYLPLLVEGISSEVGSLTLVIHLRLFLLLVENVCTSSRRSTEHCLQRAQPVPAANEGGPTQLSAGSRRAPALEAARCW